jgi:hypothetical protein
MQKALATNYKGAKITEAAKIVTAATNATTYEAETSQGGKHRDVRFNADGTEVKKWPTSDSHSKKRFPGQPGSEFDV